MSDVTILTPKPRPEPRINGAKVFGVRPGSPIVFKVAATGQSPLNYEAEGLPVGVELDQTTGILSGRLSVEGTHSAQLTVSNGLGSSSRELRIVVGDEICLTPPMGWNSWYCWSESVDDEKIRSVAKAMVDKGLVDHGWSYVNIDDCWQGDRGGEYHAIQGNHKFPDMTALGDYVHSLGLRFGIYSTCWMASYAGYIGGSAPNAEGDYSEKALPEEERINPSQIYGRFPGSINKGMAQIGPHWFVDADAKQFADWGIDYVKFDWCNWDLVDGRAIRDDPKSAETMSRLLGDLRAVQRDIVLSLSPCSRPGNGENLAKHSNLWRATNDIHDTWSCLEHCLEIQDWYALTRPGAYSDPDMLQIGKFGVPNRQNRTLCPTKLTPDEQYTQVTLWALVSAPLLLSCDIESMDDFTLGLVTNDEVIEINQDPLCKAAVAVSRKDGLEVWRKELEDGSIAVGLFNRTDAEAEVSASWADLRLDGPAIVRDAWRQEDLGSFEGLFSTSVNAHGSSLLVIRQNVLR